MNKHNIKITASSQLVGINNVKLSCVDNVIYIANTNTVAPGILESIAVYNSVDGHLISSGEKLTWNNVDELLSVENLSANTINVTDHLTVSKLTSTLLTCNWLKGITLEIDCIEGKVITSNSAKVNTLAFLEDNILFAGFHVANQHLALSVNEKENIVLSFDRFNRVKVTGKLNVKSCAENICPSGSIGDQEGDVLINKNYIYYCTTDYTGTDDIWVRWAVTDTTWEN